MIIVCTNCFNRQVEREDTIDLARDLWCDICGMGTKWKALSSIFEQLKTKSRSGSATFYKLLEEASNVHDSKSHDYASNSDPLGNYRFAGELSCLFSDSTDSGLIGRFGEKLYRLSNLDKKESGPLNESIEDTEKDLLVIIGLFAANRKDRRERK